MEKGSVVDRERAAECRMSAGGELSRQMLPRRMCGCGTRAVVYRDSIDLIIHTRRRPTRTRRRRRRCRTRGILMISLSHGGRRPRNSIECSSAPLLVARDVFTAAAASRVTGVYAPTRRYSTGVGAHARIRITFWH